MIRLSKRKIEILLLMSEGLTNKEIAVRLNIHEQTVKNHVTDILHSVNAKNRAHAVTITLRSGLIK